jgi:uncharacterized protein DUF6160
MRFIRENVMKSLKKIALASAIAAISAGAQAQFEVMDDAMLGETTGQAGISIDLTADVRIGEIAYKDDGFIAIRGVTLGGAYGGSLDNLTIDIDVAGNASDIAILEAESGITGLGDGDLVINIGATDGNEQNVDFGLSILEVSLEKSTYSPSGKGAFDPNTNTVLVSDLNLMGRLGPVDIVISEEGSYLWMNAFFAVDDGYFDLPFMNVSIGTFRINNSRGTTPTGNFAQATTVVAASAKGLMIDLITFSADMDIEDISIGSNSIGSLYVTDLEVTATMDVYGH